MPPSQGAYRGALDAHSRARIQHPDEFVLPCCKPLGLPCRKLDGLDGAHGFQKLGEFLALGFKKILCQFPLLAHSGKSHRNLERQPGNHDHGQVRAESNHQRCGNQAHCRSITKGAA